MASKDQESGPGKTGLTLKKKKKKKKRSAEHIWNLANEPKAIVSCRHIKISDPHAAYRCTSLFDDSFCATEGSGSYYYGKRCFNDSSHVTSQMKAVNHYFEHLTSPPNADFDLPRLLYTFFVYCSLALLGVFGVRVIRLFLAFTYVCFICALLISFAQFVDVARFIIAFKALVRATDPEAIYDIQAYGILHRDTVTAKKMDENDGKKKLQISSFHHFICTYLAAFYASVVSSGLGLSGILCISSFRARNGDSFRLTYGIMFNNVVVSIISLLCFLFAMSAISRQYRLDTTDVTAAGYNFAIAAITEVFMVKEKYVIWLIIYHISVYVVSILTFCGPLIIICAIVRDIAERHRQLWTAWAIIAFCLSAFLASVPRSIVTFGDQWDKTIVMLKDCTTFFVVAIMIVAFVLVYGEREYVIDLSQLYPIKDGDRPWSSPAHPAQIGHFLIAECFAVVTMVMTFVYNFTGYTHSVRTLFLEIISFRKYF
ncbi:hypothetical protein Y032_0021g425 [Ancylostoma ceylanicum]|uniref:Uncharacterized protein n=1 Tax=Ancylostoma ceylanicum TaxID=53326 RepID=A0A016UZD4_9BILA|nr:hypothetical protein Y032_0021g425 [Ancylostoma ceylanicum]